MCSASIWDSSTNATAITAVPTTGKILYRPVRPTMTPLLIEVSSRPATIGSVRRPDTVADTPSTNCMNVGRNVSAPSIAKPTMNDSTQHTVNTGLREQSDRQNRFGRTGFHPDENRREQSAEAANRPMMTGEAHG